MQLRLPGDKKTVLSWAFYDWANSAFATTVMAGFFPLFFKQYWSAGTDVATSTFYLGVTNSATSLVIALMAPLLGAMADSSGSKKRFLLGFTVLGVVMTGLLCTVGQGQWQWAALCFALASVGFSGAIIFSDALLVSVCKPEDYETVSALGYALGYLGGGLLFAGNVLLVLQPGWFGLADSTIAVQLSFLSVSVWWAVFSVPLLRNVPEPSSARLQAPSFRAGLRQLGTTLREIHALKPVFLFLLAYWFYIDGVDTIVRMSVDYGMSLGFSSNHLITALLLTQFVGFPAAIGFGMLGRRFGPRRGIYLAIAVYIGVIIWAFFMESSWEFYGIAVVVGLVQGGIQSLSRSLYARLIPPERSAEFFGFYNMLGKFAAVLGPVLMGWVGVMTGNPRYSILSVALLFIVGGLLLSRVQSR